MPHINIEQGPHLIEEKNGFSESVRLYLVNIIHWILESIAHIKIDDKSLQNLEKLDLQLQTSSVVGYGYHSSIFDSVVLPIIISRHLDNIDSMIAPIAITHYQGLQKVFVDMISYLTNTQFLPVVRGKDEPHYERQVKRDLLKRLLQVTRQSLTQPGNLYGVAPTSTRDKVLHSAEVNPGFIKIAQKYQAPLMPMAFTKNDSGLLQFHAGEILSPPKKSEPLNTAVNMHMSILAQLLPTELRGDYL